MAQLPKLCRMHQWCLAAAVVVLVCGVQLCAATDLKVSSRRLSQDAAQSSTSNIIPSAGQATLTNGVGDVLLTGPCQADAKAFCKDLEAGEGRIASCLTEKIRAQRKGNVAGRKVTDKCIEAVAQFKIDRATNINKDISLATACAEDAKKLCSSVSDSTPGSVIACLRNEKKKLSVTCKNEVFRTTKEAVEDYRVDAQLYAACKTQVEQLCADAEEGDGSQVECLVAKHARLDWKCLDQVLRIQKEQGDDIRLMTKLFNKCYTTAQKFCKDVEPGHMRVQECLEDNMDATGFAIACKEELEATIERRVVNFKLDSALRDACEDDLKDTCGTSVEAIDQNESLKPTAIKCLQDHREELKDDKCKNHVRRLMKRAARDFRFDEVLANACMEDRNKFCHDVQPGSARVIRCLQDHRDSLAPKCTAALFDHEVRMAEDIDFKYPMKKACAWEISTFCKSVPKGHARVIRCLETHLEHQDMSKECKEEVERDQRRMAQDFRLNWRLKHACDSEISRLCSEQCNIKDGQPCGGLVLQCLQEKQDNITNQACQDEVFYYELMEVSDFRNDIILAEACRQDVEKYCKDVQPGEGRVHQCLRFHRDYISDRCRNEEMKLAAVEYRDIRLRPKLNKLCSEEKAVYCKDVKPGKARVIKCLLENMAQPNFGDECKQELEKREEAMKNDYRYDVGVFTQCAADVDAYCSEQKNKLRGNATVLKCLVERFKEVTDPCQGELSRAVRFALWDYKSGAALTTVCDEDVDANCPKGTKSKTSGLYTIGAVGRCLSRGLVEGKRLAPKCRDLVLVAAPKDTRVYFEYPESTSLLVQKIAQMQRAAGLEAVLVDPYARDGSTVTITGWVALACMLSLVLVAVGGAIQLYKRLTGADKPHTLHVKMGDA